MLDGNAVRSVDRAASLLIALGETQGEAGVTELARRLGLHKSTASRLLATLQKRGLVEQDDDSGKYRLGLAVVRLGGHAEKSLDLRSIALPELESLARSVHETTTLEVLEGDSVLTIAYSDASPLEPARARGHPSLQDRLHAVHLAHDRSGRPAPGGAGSRPQARLRDRLRRARALGQRHRRAGVRPAIGGRRRPRGPCFGQPDHPISRPGARRARSRVRGHHHRSHRRRRRLALASRRVRAAAAIDTRKAPRPPRGAFSCPRVVGRTLRRGPLLPAGSASLWPCRPSEP